MTVTVDDARESGISTWAADTTIASETAARESRSTPRSRAALSPFMTSGSARKPSVATRSSNVPASGSTNVNSPRALVSSDRSSPPPAAMIRAPAIGRSSGSTTRPVTGPAARGAAIDRQRKSRGMDRTFTGLLSACSRAALREKRKGRPGVRILARGSSSPFQPSHALAQWLRRQEFVAAGFSRPWRTNGNATPAYSGGTAWASHPLRMTAGRAGLAGSSSVVPAGYHAPPCTIGSYTSS